MRIVEICGPDAVSRLQDEWQALQMECPHATPYQTWEWNVAWWRHFGSRKSSRILLFYIEGAPQPVGLAPLYTSWHLGLPLRRLAWMGTGPSDYLGLLASPPYSEQVAAALLAHMRDDLRRWDMADLQQLRPDAPIMTHAPVPWPDQPLEFQTVLPMEPCPHLPLPETWQQFTGGLGKILRSNLCFLERLLTKTFPEARYLLADATNLELGMTALFDLHQKRWNARWLPGVLGGRRVQAFHREVAARFLDNGWLRLHLLEVEGEVRSALYCFCFKGRTFYYLGGFSLDMSKYSLGTLLTAHAIRTAIEERCTEFDFLRGKEPYKYRWLPAERTNHRLLLLRSRSGLGEWPGRAGVALAHVERYVVYRAKAFADGKRMKES